MSNPEGGLRGPGAVFGIPGAGRRPDVTYALMAANVAILVVMEIAGGSSTDGQTLLDFGAMYGPYISEGQYWRLLTAMFLHAGILHLGFNVFGLWVFGRVVEDAFGRARFGVIYVLSGLLGGALSYLLNPIAIAVGASGAVFGLMGALSAYFLVQRRVLGRTASSNLYALLILGAINVVFGVITPEIDFWAHVGGFAAGFGLGLVLAPQYLDLPTVVGELGFVVEVNRSWRTVTWAIPATLAVLALVVWGGNATLPPNALTQVLRAEELIESGQTLEAEKELDVAISETLGPEASLGRAYFLRGQLRAEWGDRRGALRDLALAARLADEDTRQQAVELLYTMAEEP